MATATRKTAAKKTASSSSADTTTKPDTGDVVPTDPNEAAPKDGDKTPEVVEPDLKVQIIDPTVEDAPEVETEDKEVGFLYVTHLDPARKLPGGTYLDDVQRYEAEAARALVEDRKPDFENAPAVQGTPLRSVDQILAELPPHVSLEAEITQTIPVVK